MANYTESNQIDILVSKIKKNLSESKSLENELHILDQEYMHLHEKIAALRALTYQSRKLKKS
ncbi:hypothetical protein [Flammeovirga kamogawensis]|uniref:IS66 family transposase n=1 Tax=Flammeovirga kamogawensis TaxID=373891 RepID=A0ABX8H014_9BACT|nr:hypothetical protein [Flammeovirga kamogawensis]MBB6458950.1 hypothetical protein [Flammeovirga kamogawensis]QWG08525.1 hypothetical protein KM029_06200 [Flammeovirga kamogawensis]TRX66818.1 hypothetical protein EO216_01250 [Flammeovirga kamogawensis]